MLLVVACCLCVYFCEEKEADGKIESWFTKRAQVKSWRGLDPIRESENDDRESRESDIDQTSCDSERRPRYFMFENGNRVVYGMRVRLAHATGGL